MGAAGVCCASTVPANSTPTVNKFAIEIEGFCIALLSHYLQSGANRYAPRRQFSQLIRCQLDAAFTPRHNRYADFSEVTMLAYLFVIIAIAVRFMPHPWMFTPVTASLLFFGARGSRRQLWVPFTLLVASDVILTKVVYASTFSWDHFVTFAWYAGVLWLGTQLHNSNSPLRIGAASLTSSVSFFLLSNFAVWACWNMYPKTLGGLMTSYTMALPFFRNAIVGDLLFTAAMFATPAVIHAMSQAFGNSGDHSAAA